MFSTIKGFFADKALLLQICETIVIGIVGGTFFTFIHIPLAWMLGPLTAVLFWQLLTKRRLHWPISLRNGGQVFLGYSMGLAFTVASAKRIASQLPSMVLATVLMVVFCFLVAFTITKLLGINLPTAVMGTTPGGLTQMVILSEEIKGAEPTIVTFMQTVRLLTVVFIVPALVYHGIGIDKINDINMQTTTSQVYNHSSSLLSILLIGIFVCMITLFAVRFRFPTPWIIGPLIGAAVLTVTGLNPPQLPDLLIIVAQFCLGIYLGLGFKMDKIKNWRRLLLLSIVTGTIIVLFSFVVAYGLSLLYPISLATAFLSIAPGGLPEMGVTAHIVKADVSMVAAFQLFRVFFILFIIPFLLRWYFGRVES